jgi:serine/threonine protein kinase
MFTTHNPALVPHFDGVMTRFSASTDHTNLDFQSDLIAFLSIVQRCNVDYLAISWQPSLGTLGSGGSSTITQSTFILDMPLAFKRFHDDGDSGMDFRPLISEVLILSQPPIQSHPNIINLEGICWEIKPNIEKAYPVLIFEKAPWDLQQFMNASDGVNMLINNRLKICAEIGCAVMILHSYGLYSKRFVVAQFNVDTGVIHGDIKPQNVLVFKDATGKVTVKVADFGYSTLATGEEGNVFLPKSRPWNAPEHHFGGWTTAAAKKQDVYSYGLLCLWVLFCKRLPEFNSPPCTLLEQLKDEDKVKQIASQHIESVSGLNPENRNRLYKFFDLTLQLDPEQRTPDLGKLVCLFGEEAWVP